MTAALALAAAALGTWCLRVVFVTVVDVDTLPAPVQEALRYVGPAVTAAITVSALSQGDGHAGLRLSAAELTGLAAAGAVMLRTGKLLWALTAAMGCLWIVGQLG